MGRQLQVTLNCRSEVPFGTAQVRAIPTSSMSSAGMILAGLRCWRRARCAKMECWEIWVWSGPGDRLPVLVLPSVWSGYLTLCPPVALTEGPRGRRCRG